MLRPFLMLMSIILLAGCAPTIKTTVVRSARAHEVAQFRELAVLPFDGNAGDRISYQAEAALSGVILDGRPYFKLVDRKKLSNVMSEMKLGQSALVEPGSMARLGKLAGARAIMGGMATEQSKETKYKEERSQCDEYAYTVEKDGKKKQGNCIRYKRWFVTCVKRQSQVTFVPRLVDVESGQIIYSRSIQRVKSASGCLDYGTPASLAELERRAWSDVFDEFRKDVAPYIVSLEIDMSNDDSGVPAGQAQEVFAQALQFAKAERLDRACELWRQISTYADAAPFLAYNLGVCAESEARYDEAEQLYRKADRQLKEPSDQLNKALARIRELQEEQRRLKEQLKRQ